MKLCCDGYACANGDTVHLYYMITPFIDMREKDDHHQEGCAWHNHEVSHVLYNLAHVVCRLVVHGDGCSLI
jgi:hypothetical protein